MATVLKLRYSTTDLSFIGGASAWVVTAWIPKAPVNGEDVEEILTLEVADSSDNALATELQTLDDLVLRVERYRNNPSYATPVWFHAKLKNETGERRALIKRLSYTQTTRWDSPAQNLIIHLTIVRAGWWEHLTNAGTASDTDLSTLGGVFDYTAAPGADINGDGARLDKLTITTSLAARSYHYAWLGWRSANVHGTLANFVPVWELEDGTPGTDSSATTDANASPGGAGNTKIRCTFATTETWTTRVALSMGDVTTDYADNYGTFLVLLRARLTAGATAVVYTRLMVNHGSDGESIFYNPIVQVDESTGWALYEMGLLTIPLRDIKAITTGTLAASHDGDIDVSVRAKRVSGAGSLDLDCLIMVPVDEYFMSIGNLGAGTGDTAYISTSPQGFTAGAADDGTDVQTICDVEAQGSSVPPGDGRIIGVVASVSRLTSITNDWDATAVCVPRWRSLRGSE